MKSTLRRIILILAVAACYYAILRMLDTSCIILYCTGIPCPTCGTTRAMLSLMRFDFDSYLSYNAMALLLVAACIAAIAEAGAKRKAVLLIFISVILALNTVYYILRLLGIL